MNTPSNEGTTSPARLITDHKVNGLNEEINVVALDGPGAGGASHEYSITLYSRTDPNRAVARAEISFQKGPVLESGFNGISNESLLAVVIDRLRGFQGLNPVPNIAPGAKVPLAKFACRENALALTKLEEAMMWLQKRTRDRMARGVEGTNAK